MSEGFGAKKDGGKPRPAARLTGGGFDYGKFGREGGGRGVQGCGGKGEVDFGEGATPLMPRRRKRRRRGEKERQIENNSSSSRADGRKNPSDRPYRGIPTGRLVRVFLGSFSEVEVTPKKAPQTQSSSLTQINSVQG